MLNILLILLGKFFSKCMRVFNLGNGSTWPGHIALNINKNFTQQILSKTTMQIIIIAGTNGKTTTATLIKTALKKNGKTVIQNQSGANLLNGIASTLIHNCTLVGKLPYDYAIFEVDENVLPLVLKQIQPEFIILLNLFRDQLDRYGEINTIAYKWKKALQTLSEKTSLILNGDDPLIASQGAKIPNKNYYFGLRKTFNAQNTVSTTADSVFCPFCNARLNYHYTNYSHLGDWYCKNCHAKRPHLSLDYFTDYPVPGVYNKYNVHAAVLLLKQLHIPEEKIIQSMQLFVPAFGRQEIISFKNKNIQIFLSKNPTSFNQSYTTIRDLDAKTLILVLNDRIPDGRDISWIWDIDLPNIKLFSNIIVSGDRVYDMALRIKYEDYNNVKTFENLEEAIHAGIKLLEDKETLFILPTYSAMLEVRKIITGKKIL